MYVVGWKVRNIKHITQQTEISTQQVLTGYGGPSNSMQFYISVSSLQYPLKFITTIIIYAQSAYSSTNATFNFGVKTCFKEKYNKNLKNTGNFG